MTTDDLGNGEIRMIKYKIKANQKQLDKATMNCDEELIKKYTYNIELYKKQLTKIEGK